jgi:carbamoyltransferase
MNILGIHGGVTINQHDAGAALLVDGRLISFVEEERLIRMKSARGTLPIQSILACLREAKLDIRDINFIAACGETYDDQSRRISEYLVHHFGYSPEIVLVNHQLAHLASAFYPSGFQKAMCISYDAYGDRLSGALGVGNRDGIEILKTFPGDNSLGIFYATITSFLGFMPGEDEYKVMGLAPYGLEPVDLSFFAAPADDGGYLVNSKYIRSNPSPASSFEQFYSDELVKKLGQPRRKNEQISDRHKNIAAGAQIALEHCIVSLIKGFAKKTGLKDLCLAGGVALNCSANRLIYEMSEIKNLFVQPSASDRGLALGAALEVAKRKGENIEKIRHVFYGPIYSEKDIVDSIALAGYPVNKVANPSKVAASMIASGKIIGWFQGRSEFGPRALGHRSILAHPGLKNIKQEINAKVKFREEFRPFAPAVISERAKEIFCIEGESPFMTIAVMVREEWRNRLPGITHINNTGRVQTVSKEDPLFYDLISEFEKITRIPVVLNTSFNIKGQPIVETPLEAISTFSGTGIDAVIIGEYLIEKPCKSRVQIN